MESESETAKWVREYIRSVLLQAERVNGGYGVCRRKMMGRVAYGCGYGCRYERENPWNGDGGGTRRRIDRVA